MYLYQSTQALKQGFALKHRLTLNSTSSAFSRASDGMTDSRVLFRLSNFFVFLLVVLGVELKTLHIKIEFFNH